MNRLVARTVLEPYRLQLSEAENGQEAIRLLQSRKFDLVLMDLHMPVMSGLEATGHIRNQLHLNIPIIALTANAIKGESEHCFKAGMNAFVSKPFEEQELVQAMLACLRSASEVRTLRAQEAEPAREQEPLFDLSQLQAISRGDEAILEAMIAVFTDESPAIMRSMKAALQAGDLAQVAALAHKIKPSIDNLGIASLHATVRELETTAKAGKDASQIADLVEKTASVIDAVCDSLRSEYQPGARAIFTKL